MWLSKRRQEPDVTDEELEAFVEERLPPARAAELEAWLRRDASLRERLNKVLAERPVDSVSLGSIWREERLSCPTRDQLGAFFLNALEPDLQDYIRFHIEVIGCPYCSANLADIADQSQAAAEVQRRRRRLFESSVGHLKQLRRDE